MKNGCAADLCLRHIRLLMRLEVEIKTRMDDRGQRIGYDVEKLNFVLYLFRRMICYIKIIHMF